MDKSILVSLIIVIIIFIIIIASCNHRKKLRRHFTDHFKENLTQTRSVVCSGGVCDPATKPPSERECSTSPCYSMTWLRGYSYSDATTSTEILGWIEIRPSSMGGAWRELWVWTAARYNSQVYNMDSFWPLCTFRMSSGLDHKIEAINIINTTWFNYMNQPGAITNVVVTNGVVTSMDWKCQVNPRPTRLTG